MSKRQTMITRLEIFLGVKIPDDIFDEISQADLLENSSVRKILPETDPQLYIDKAAFITIGHNKAVAATMHVTPEMCRGHFD